MPQPNHSGEAVYTLRISRDTLDQLREIAASEHRTLAQKLRVIIERESAEPEPHRP